jgi:predicted transcriptional regulator
MTIIPLPNSELAVMDLIWQADRLTAREIQENLYAGAEKAQHGTVQKLLSRLEDKGFVSRDRSLTVHSFSARITRDEYAYSQLESLADRLTEGSLAPMITRMVEERKLSATEIERLRKILEEA